MCDYDEKELNSNKNEMNDKNLECCDFFKTFSLFTKTEIVIIFILLYFSLC